MFKYNAAGISLPKTYSLLPDGWYPFKILEAEEGTSSKGNDMVKIVAEVFNDERYAGKTIWHWVVFLPPENKGAGMGLHFLKCIGEPHEGSFAVDAAAWVGKKFMGKVITENYQGKDNNKIKEISPMDGTSPAKSDDEVPF